VEYVIKADDGENFVIRIENVLWVPDAPVRLVCPQQLIDQTEEEHDSFAIQGKTALLTYKGRTLTIPYDEGNNLPIVVTEAGTRQYANYLCRECDAFPAMTESQGDWFNSADAAEEKGDAKTGDTDNMTAAQRKLLMWHKKLSHRNMADIQAKARNGELSITQTELKLISSVRQDEFPKCPACQFGDQNKSAVKTRGKIDEGDNKPGDGVSGDQLEAGTPGLIPTTKGRRTKKRHGVATIWVDHFSRLVYAHMQESTDAAATVEAKLAFEQFAARYNVNVKKYRTDNGAFAAKEFRDAVAQAKQDMTHCGVGAHWQNGIVERYIGSITRWARTMLLEAMEKWPGVITEEFWTFAVRQAVNIHNAMVQKGKDKTPWELFTDEECPWSLKDFQVFGCPVYVLEAPLQDGNNVGKWKKRARLGVYVGHSTHHSGNVVLVYNPDTGHVSPQFHVVMDNGFTTVSKGNRAKTKRNMDKAFESLFVSERWQYTDDFEDTSHHYHFDDIWDSDDIDSDSETAITDDDATNDGNLEPTAQVPKKAPKRAKVSFQEPVTTEVPVHEGVIKEPRVEGNRNSAGSTPESTSVVRPTEIGGISVSEGDKILIARPRSLSEVDVTTKTVVTRDVGTQTLTTPPDLPEAPAMDNQDRLISSDTQQEVADDHLICTETEKTPTEHLDDSTGPKLVSQLGMVREGSMRKSSRPEEKTISFMESAAANPTVKTRSRRSSKRRRGNQRKRLASYPKGTNDKKPQGKSLDFDLGKVKAMLSQIDDSDNDTAMTAELTDNESDSDDDSHSKDDIEAAIHAHVYANLQTVDDGSEDGVFNIDNPLIFNSMLSKMEGKPQHLIYNSLLDSMNNKEDILTQGQMLKTEDRAKFEEAQEPEIQGLEEMGVFEYMKMQDLPHKAKLLNAIWSYRRKRRPDGTLLKYKARLCADGSRQQKGVDYEESFAPVVGWSTVRMMLTIAAILNLQMRQIDFIQAFPQADCSEDTYMRLPAGWDVKDADGNSQHCIRLKKNLYGTVTGARNWYKKLAAGLIARGFHQSVVDPCLFLRGDCMVVVYTDDCICFSKSTDTATRLIEDLKADGFLLKDEGDAKDFLGVRMDTERDTRTGKISRINMTQTGLIDSILSDLGLTDCKAMKDTASAQVLHPDKEGAGRQESHKWNYRSIIGKMNYLAMNTRPDISFAVHQCAKFCNSPRLLHEKAVKYIGRYLAKTRDKGMILTPEDHGKLDAYVDSDFAGRWHQLHAQMRETVLSRTGFVITYCGCPVTWSSKLQTEIALSTTEAEYIALSTMMRTLLPMRQLLAEVQKVTLPHLNIENSTTSTRRLMTSMPSEVFEDNAGCIVLATTDQFRPRTKHLAIKWHHFKDQVRNGNVTVTKVASALNWADIFTKSTDKTTFQTLRRLMMGW